MYKHSMAFVASILVLLMGETENSFAEPAQKIPVKIFAQLKTASQMVLSPDGEHIAYFSPYKGRQVILIKPVRGDVIAAIPSAENAEISWFEWANNKRIILSYAYTGKRGVVVTRETRLYGVDLDGQNMKNLIKPRGKQKIGTRLGKEEVAAQIQDDVIDWLLDDPDNILVALDSNQDGKDEVRKINVYTGKFKELVSGRRGIQHYRTDQQHELRLSWGYDELNKFYNMYKSPVTNRWKSIVKTPWGEKGFSLLSFTKDPRIAFASGYNEQRREAVYKINLETNEILGPVFSHEVVDFDWVVKHPETGQPIGIQYTVDQPKVKYFNKKLQSIQMTIDHALKGTANRIVSMLSAKKLYLIHANSDVDPGAYYLLDMINKKLDFISETMPGIVPENMSQMKAVSFKSRDGVDIPAYLTLPKGAKAENLPTVVLIHGGPHSRYKKMFDYTAQFLANRGYAVLQPNFRGSEGYGAAYEEAGVYQWGGVMQDDVTDGTKWLIEQGIADPKRICIAGASYGGYAAAMGLIKTPDLFKCGISVSAVLNIPSMIRFDKKFIGGKPRTKTMGLQGKKPKEVSPYHRADEINAPLLIIHAKDDSRVRFRQAEKMVKKLKKLKKDVTFVVMEDGGHTLDTEASRITKLSAMEKFLKKHIGQ